MQDLSVSHLQVGSWPGPGFHNQFVELFCKSLEEFGLCDVHTFDPRRTKSVAIDVLHIHWPEMVFWEGGSLPRVMFRLVSTILSLRRLKRSGVILVWTVHNLHPHDLELRFKPLWLIYLRQLCQLVDGFVTLSPNTLDIVRLGIRGLRRKPAIYAWHPPYPRPASFIDPAEFRKQAGLPLNATVFAFVGLVRPYKGIEELIHVFRKIDGENYALVVAGKALHEEYGATIRHLSAGDSRIRLFLRDLSEEEFAGFCKSADLVVLPFRDSLHSGSLIHAVSQPSVVLTPDSPFSISLKKAIGEDWVHTYSPPLSAEIILPIRRAKGIPFLDELSTSVSGAKLAEFYHLLMVRNRGDKQRNLTERRL